jgi:hypothetical protein
MVTRPIPDRLGGIFGWEPWDPFAATLSHPKAGITSRAKSSAECSAS